MHPLNQSQQAGNKIPLNEAIVDIVAQSGEQKSQIEQTKYLHNYLEYYEDFIDRLITQFNLTRRNTQNYSEIDVLNTISHASDADLVLVLVGDREEKWDIKHRSNLNDNLNYDDDEKIITQIISSINFEQIFNPAYHGTYHIYQDNQNISKAFVVLPLQEFSQAEVIVICGLTIGSNLLVDVYGKIISSFYQASQHNFPKVEVIEATILDSLKYNFGFLSSSLYQRRFDLFYQRLKQMVVYFEPVLNLEPDDLFISGWEALARNPENYTAPTDLFTAAELWGSRFTVELDRYFLNIACESYRHARQLTQRRAGDVVPLSVNVYPESIMRSDYFEAVQQIVKDRIISPRNLILEISEKSELPQFDHGIRLQNPLQTFKSRLIEYVSQLKVRFAIDDFGVGYASVSRLAGLNPSHVKIDRELLQHHSSHIIINFVHELVGANNLNPAKVIVEGIDETIAISLRLLREIGVSYIQGHLVGKPQPEVYRLSQDKYDELKKMLLQ
ncbi:EAL domain-containing protein [Calothrix sp. UHCC 0171]|uniref:EAL domain-containing protein n=1 Tax=Calothrix sp. UHCC 0171 TaxID=3110245 RepID=UPI002B1F92B9|nr:EAL domain-containing protein [Calothrix sp. UHCC 0171]MEA5574109.1 EAL domain-containing protein [Calothrix sp. UHCC 0171]